MYRPKVGDKGTYHLMAGKIDRVVKARVIDVEGDFCEIEFDHPTVRRYKAHRFIMNKEFKNES